jgi:hypothetical protein
MTELALAPLGVTEKNHFFLPITNGFINEERIILMNQYWL